jgi:hypothetical protein
MMATGSRRIAGGGNYLLDLVERAGATYVESFLGLMVASGIGTNYLTDVSVWNKALIACAPTLLSIVKGGLARFTGAPNSASLLPAKDDPPGGNVRDLA